MRTFLNRFQPGFQAPKHLHRGEVHAYTLEGCWHYLEYDWVSRAGDYVYEPPDTAHMLKVPDDNAGPTTVFFSVAKGMDLYDDAGNVFDPGHGHGCVVPGWPGSTRARVARLHPPLSGAWRPVLRVRGVARDFARTRPRRAARSHRCGR